MSFSNYILSAIVIPYKKSEGLELSLVNYRSLPWKIYSTVIAFIGNGERVDKLENK